MNARALLASFLAALVCLPSAESAEPPVTGVAVEGMKSYDRLVPAFMHKWAIPGGAVAVAKDGRLVFARGYGWANVEAQKPVEPRSLFRLASVSKPFTAVTILKLVEQGKLKLDARVCTVLDLEPNGPKADERWREITIRQMLHHTGGWDRDTAFDPMFRSYRIAEELGTQPPASSGDVIAYMLRRPLQHTPGQKYVYSNFGYCLLGRVIEKRTGLDYETAVQQLVLKPCGIERMHLGHTRLREQRPNEVHYYNQPDSELARSVFPDVKREVAWPYGGFYLEAMDSHGGWIGSAPDLLRFVTSLEGSRKPHLLTNEQRSLMLSRPAPPVSVDKPTWYGLGWSVREVGKRGHNWWHGGSLPGTSTLLVHTSNGTSWAILFNSRPDDDTKKKHGDFNGELDDLMWKGFEGVTHWPEHDLFESTP